MNKKHISKTIAFTFVTALMLSSFMLSDNLKAFAFLGFDLFVTNEEDQTASTTSQSSTSLQNARCYTPTGSIVDSCNSGDLSNSDSKGYSTLGQ
ncbi:MAG TPA: hypothetical protein VJP58_11185 [Candidatus Nitrosocosmicus sp.]|nr:hypothetical protein [Candidatus Nitrosocosmicus sp.]